MPPTDFQSLLTTIGVRLSQSIKARLRSGLVRPTTNKAGATLVKSAKLLNSIHYQVAGNRVIVGTNLAYARIQHEGGTITPRHARFLAIPLCPEASVRKPRDFDHTFIAKGVIFQTVEGKEPRPLYALKRSVKLPARPFLFLDDPTRDTLRNLVAAYVNQHLHAGAH